MVIMTAVASRVGELPFSAVRAHAWESGGGGGVGVWLVLVNVTGEPEAVGEAKSEALSSL